MNEKAIMRAKLKVVATTPTPEGNSESLEFQAVSANFGENGESEDNTYARWTPMASLAMQVNNPELIGKIKAGDEFYIDFIPTQGAAEHEMAKKKADAKAKEEADAKAKAAAEAKEKEEAANQKAADAKAKKEAEAKVAAAEAKAKADEEARKKAEEGKAKKTTKK